MRIDCTLLVCGIVFHLATLCGAEVARKVVRDSAAGENLLKQAAWRSYEQGYSRQGAEFVCDNGADAKGRRGVAQSVVLNQKTPAPIVASAWSRAENVGGSRGPDYSIYLDLVYMDGDHLWGQSAAFDTGTHDWQKRQVKVVPEKPVRSVSFYLLLRGHSGKAVFKDAQLRQVVAPAGAYSFDGTPVIAGNGPAGFSLRAPARDTDYVAFENGTALGMQLETKSTRADSAEFVDVMLKPATASDQAVQLVYTQKLEPGQWMWLADPRRSEPAQSGRDYRMTSYGGRLSMYPLAAVSDGRRGRAIAIDMEYPAMFRAGFNGSSRELYIVYDLGFQGNPSARLRFCTFEFEGEWGFRSALSAYYKLFPAHFQRRVQRQGLWMPFHKISQVRGWEDFGFAFKEGDNEVEWDDAHDIVTFRYTEPMTWWMSMPKGMPRTMEAALGEARRLAAEGKAQALALMSSGYHDERGQFPARLLDTPWSDGAVWSMNSSPGVQGDVTDFSTKWNQNLRRRLYGPTARGKLDGEYIDSAEGYVTDELNFRQEHFLTAQTPVTYAADTYRPAIFRGLIAFEYVRAIARDVHGMGRLMMANSTPGQLCWLAPWLDVMGTETDWNHGGKWSPMSDRDMLYRRALSARKPYCFLMNTNFDAFGPDKVEKYMKRSLAYGMFPGFFSPDASRGHYFSRPELYDRDRELFRKYVPLCRLVAEAGWEPVTLARSDNAKVYVERWGRRYLTLFNDSTERQTARVRLEGIGPAVRELVGGKELAGDGGVVEVTLEGEDVAVVELKE